MINRCSPCNISTNLLIQRDANIPVGCFRSRCSCTPKPKTCLQCSNLIQNPSFETDLTSWVTDNVSLTGSFPFEGTQSALMQTGVASIYQHVSLGRDGKYPLFLSFNVFPGDLSNLTGSLVAEVLWLDVNRNIIGTGLSFFIPNGRINSNGRITYFDITDRPPANAAWARLQFSKGAGIPADYIALDQVILAPVNTINLVQNPSFESGLAYWTSTNFVPDFSLPLEGAAQAATTVTGELSQDVFIKNLPARSKFMLSFGVASPGLDSLSVQVQWLDASDNPIGSGLNLSIPTVTLLSQNNYLTYLDITDPAPIGTVKARIRFDCVVHGTSILTIDQVIFARVATENLVINPSFEDGLNGWTPVNTIVFTKDDVYEGNKDAQVDVNGGSLVQDLPICNAVGHCFLFNCGLGYRVTGEDASSAQMLIKLLWLDKNGTEIGPGLSIIGNLDAASLQWFVYTGITEPAPPGTVAARLQFTKPVSNNSVVEIDKVVLGRLI